MSTAIIIIICTILLLAYFFDISASKTRIPSVILLLLLGWGVKQGTLFLDLSIPNLTTILPILGTIGLVLIVLEGSLELELNASNLSIIGKSSLMAILPIFVISFGLTYAFVYFEGSSFKTGLINAIPLAIISSAIAIPSARYLMSYNKDFVTYESSLSDIFGVIFFNFITLNDKLDTLTFGIFFLQLILMIVLSFGATIGLALLLRKIKHHIKFTPIIILIVLIYSVSKMYHLPSLVFILIFGLFIGNLDELKRFKFIAKIRSDILNKEVHKFKEITIEMTFLIRALFFLLFGYLIESKELLNPDTLIWAVAIVFGIFIIRAIFLKILQLQLNPLLYIAPRGLITILLFLSIPLGQELAIANKSLILQIIILTAFVMMFGLMNHKNKSKTNSKESLDSSHEANSGTS